MQGGRQAPKPQGINYMVCQGTAFPGVGDDTLMSRADISGGNGRPKPVGAPRPPTSRCNPRMQFINHSASDGHAVRRAAGGTAVGPSGC